MIECRQSLEVPTYQQFYETERHTLHLTDEDIEVIRMGG